MAVQSRAPSKSRKPASGEKALRADAQRNRDKLLEVAAAAFAEHGVEASLEKIARRARVGIGTLYRHFPTREHLVEVVYRREVELLCGAADELAQRERPDVALEQWMHRFVGFIATKRGMANSLQLLSASNSQLFTKTWGMVPQALQRLVEAAAAASLIRKDIESGDVLQALVGIYSAPRSADWHERSRRLVRLLMDGLRAGAHKKKATGG